MNISFTSSFDATSGTCVVFAKKGNELTSSAKAYDEKTGGAISRAIEASRFEGGAGEKLDILAPSGVDLNRIVVVGLGDVTKLTPRKLEEIAGPLMAAYQASGETTLTVCVDNIEGLSFDMPRAAAHFASGLRLRAYRFDKYRTKEKAKKKPSITDCVIAVEASKEAEELFTSMDAVMDGVYMTRDLISEPANVLHPESFAEIIEGLEDDGVKVTVLGEKELEKIGMGALLGVGQGSVRESQVVIMEWKGGAKDEAPVAFVGKGVTFDTGGISLKPGAGMDEMKWDMGGSGIVVGAMRALARRKAKANVVAAVGLVENMPSGNAQRPGDVVTSLSGQTIEILNTDAEGRLVLADVLWYTQDVYKPKVMIDLATLTGAMIIALGQNQYAGYFTPDEEVSAALFKAGDDTGDKVWRFPLTPEYDAMINSPIADVKNLGERGAGSITAAQFLKRFTNGVPWAHIDVAGVVWDTKGGKLWDKGATGYGVRLLDRYVADNFEEK